MSQTKQLVQLIEGLEKREFDKIVKIYLRKEYNYNSIVITDGKSDTGIDIKVFDFEGQKIQFQLTTQKSSTNSEKISFDKKIIEDLEKAKINNQQYRYRDKLIFFYSQKLSNSRIREYEKLSFRDYGINLEMIDANRLAEESENIIDIQRELYQLSELDQFNIKNATFDNPQENLIFDLLSFGKPTEFKIQVVESFVLQLFFTKGTLSKDDIIQACEEKFHVKENSVFYDKLISRFQTEKRIIKDRSSSLYTLSPDEKKLLDKKNGQFEFDRDLFVKEINDILEKYEQPEGLTEYINELKKLYVENFNNEINQVLANDDEFQLNAISKDFIKFIEKRLKDKSQTTSLAKELLKYCLGNKFIQKIAASKVYCSKIDNRRLQSYLSRSKKIFIDTSIGLFGLCYYYNPKLEYNNYFFRATKNLLEFASKEKMKLYISERYIWEVQNHIKEAYNLIPFTSIPNFKKLGTSRNVFYNYYNFLKSNNELGFEKSLKEFLIEFGFSESNSSKSHNSTIENALQHINIYKQVIEKEYILDETNVLFDKALSKLLKSKTIFSRNNDSVMLEFLADDDVEIHMLEPVFVTWDKSFFDVHIQFAKRYPSSNKWLMLTPNKIVDVYALLKFSINTETVTENLLALMSDDLINNTHSLIDTLTTILNPNDEVGLEYVNRLADIREKEIDRVGNDELTPPENYEGEAIIDDIFFKLTSHYREQENKLEPFKRVFTRKEVMEDVMRVLMKVIDDFYISKKIDDNLFFEFDKLIERANSDENLPK